MGFPLSLTGHLRRELIVLFSAPKSVSCRAQKDECTLWPLESLITSKCQYVLGEGLLKVRRKWCETLDSVPRGCR